MNAVSTAEGIECHWNNDNGQSGMSPVGLMGEFKDSGKYEEKQASGQTMDGAADRSGEAQPI